MLVTNMEIWQAHTALQDLLKEPWPVKTAYGLTKLARKIKGAYADIEEVRTGLIRQHGELNEKGQLAITPTSPHWETFAAAFNELMGEETELDVQPVSLPTDTPIAVVPATLMALESFIEIAA